MRLTYQLCIPLDDLRDVGFRRGDSVSARRAESMGLNVPIIDMASTG